jgi:hypothetical protein
LPQHDEAKNNRGKRNNQSATEDTNFAVHVKAAAAPDFMVSDRRLSFVRHIHDLHFF